MKVRGKPFKKGEGGRPKGAKNKHTKLQKEMLSKLMDQTLRLLHDKTKDMDAYQLIMMADKVGKYHFQELMKIETDNFTESNNQHEVVIRYVDYNKPADVADDAKDKN